MSKINVWHYIFMAKFEILSKKKAFYQIQKYRIGRRRFIFLSLSCLEVAGTRILNYSLGEHGIGDFYKSCDIGPFNVIDITVAFNSVFFTLIVNSNHDIF